MTLFLGWLGYIKDGSFFKEKESEKFLIFKEKDMGFILKGEGLVGEGEIKFLIDGKILNNNYFEDNIINSYKNYEEKLFEKLEGYYALSFIDFQNKNLTLARDIFGSKFLYYYFNKNFIVFSNDLNLLKKFPGIELSIDKQAFYDYISLFFIPAPLTFYYKIKALLPGEFLKAKIIGKSEIEIVKKRYYKWDYFIEKKLHLKEALKKLETIFEESIKKNLNEKRDIACLLSGGLDSSLVAYFSKKNIKGNVFSYNVKFKEKFYDESQDAHKVSKYIGTEHKTIEIDKLEKKLEDILDILKIYGQPFADSSLFPSNYIFKAISSNQREILTGEGGDEAFGINPIFFKVSILSFFPFMNLFYIFSKILSAFRFIPSSYVQKIKEFTQNDSVANLQTVYTWVRKEEHKKLILFESQEPLRRYFEPYVNFSKLKGFDFISLLSTKNLIENFLPNDFLYKMEIASRNQNLILIHPFLNKELFQFGISLPLKMKKEKLILKELAKKFFPKEIYKKKKKGFGIPFDTWVGQDLKKDIVFYLREKLKVLKDYLNVDILNQWINSFFYDEKIKNISRMGLYQRIVMLLSLSVHL